MPHMWAPAFHAGCAILVHFPPKISSGDSLKKKNEQLPAQGSSHQRTLVAVLSGVLRRFQLYAEPLRGRLLCVHVRVRAH